MRCFRPWAILASTCAQTNRKHLKLLCICFLTFYIVSHATAFAWQPPTDPTSLSAEEQKEKAAADKFLELLLKRPATGTALDRVFGYHVERGSIGALLEDLTKQASAAKGDESGRLWFLIGLLQLQRGEDANAVKALAQAQELLKDNAMVAFHHGQALILVGDTDHAAEAFETAVTRKPPRTDYLNVARELGRLYQRAGRVDDALRIWNTLEKDFPGDDSVRQRIASTLAEEGDLKGALARYEALAKSAKAENDRVSYALEVANLRSQTGQKQQATDELDVILAKLRPGSYLYDEARRRVERIFLSSGDYVGLTEYYQRWVKNHPDDLNVMLRLARTLSLQGRGAEAIEQFQEAIKRAPNDPTPRLALIDAYVADNRHADAAKQFEPLLANGENNPDYLVKFGQILMSDTTVAEADRQKAAAEVWKRLITARPKDAAVRSQVADLLRGAKLSDEAIAQYREAIALAPEEPQHKEYLGEYLYQLKRNDEALAVWRSLAEGQQRTRDNLVRLAEVLHQFQQPEEALKTMSEACQLKPQVSHRLRYVDWLIDAKEFSKASDQLALARTEAESVEDRARVFSSAMKTYQAAGELTERIAEATTAAEAAPSDSEKWRQLAVLHEANQAPSEALKAIEKAIAADASSIETLDVAARMAQTAGRLPEAIEYRKRLVEIDRRFRTAHMQRLSTLYVSSGQNDLAVSTGKEMLAGAGGAIEAFKFYADLCGQLGMRDERLDTLRRCLRLNPRSQEALGWLADQLSADFKTDQAIELVWKILDGAEEIEKRREAVVKLTELYLRNNRLDQLINRLEFRGRESNDRRTTADLVATAYQQAGDLGLARETLELLLREGGRDTVLLERMVALCEQAGEVDRAIDLQRELMRINPNKQTQSRLASLLIDVGGVEEAQSLWLSTVDLRADSAEIGVQVERLFSRGEQRAALALSSKVIEANPQDWEMLTRRMVLYAEAGSWADADKDAQALMALNISDDTLSVQAQKMQARNNRPQAVNARSFPKRLQRTQNIYELYYLVDPRYGSMQQVKLPTLTDVGTAKSMARYVRMRHLHDENPEALDKQLEEARAVAMKPEATKDQVWEWFTAKSLSESVTQRSVRDYRSPDSWEEVWRLTEVDPADGGYQLINMISSRTSMADRNNAQLKPLSDEQLGRLKKLIVDMNKEGNSQNIGMRYSLPALYTSELKIAGKDAEAKNFAAEMRPPAGTAPADIGSLMALVSFGNDEELWPAIEAALDPKNKSTLQQQVGGSSVLQVANMFMNAERVKKELSPGPEDQVYRQRCFTLLDRAVKNLADGRTSKSQLRLASLGAERRNYVVVNGMAQQVAISFPPYGLGPDDQSLMLYRTANEFLKDHIETWLQQLVENASDMEPRLQVQRLLTAAILRQWQDRTDDALGILQRATEIAAKEVSHEDAQLRLMQADLLLRQDRKQEALKAIEGITVYDQGAMAVREFAAARLAVNIGDKERARQAARRLFGVRLETDTQIALAKLMHSLEMPELADDLVRRMRSRSGGSTEQLQTLMNYFKTQNENDQAAQVAIELLQRSAPMRTKGNNRRSNDQAGRAAALQVLAGSGRLKELIANTEKRLERAPKSQRIQTELVEMYVAAGQNDKVQQMAAAMESKDGKPATESTAALEAMVQQLSSANKSKELCEVYLKLLKRKPQYMENSYYEVVQAFRQNNRLDDLIDLVVEVGTHKFEIYRVSELCSEALRNDRSNAKARQLLLAVLSRKDVRAANLRNLGYVISNATSLLKDKEIYDKLVTLYLDTSKLNTSDWSTIFESYSTDQDGRTTNGLTLLLGQLNESSEQLEAMEKQVRESLEKNKDWIEGKAWLGLILAALKRFDEATAQLEPMLSKDFKPALTHDACWVIGSFIDRQEAMRPLAARLYDFGLAQQSNRIQNNFQYSMTGRACRLAVEMGDKEKGRQMLRKQLEEVKKNPSNVNYNNAEYEAYMRINTATSMMELLSLVDAHADALKVARELDRNDFTKAARYGSTNQQQFEERVEKLLADVRKQGGVGALMAMIDASAKSGLAVDFGVSLSEQPFTGAGLQSIWLDLLKELQGTPAAAKDIGELTKLLAKLKTERADDLSVKLAHAIVTSAPDSQDELLELINNPPATPAPTKATTAKADDAKPKVPTLVPLANPFGGAVPTPAQKPAGSSASKTHSELLACLILRWNELMLAKDSAASPQKAIDWIKQHAQSWSPTLRAGLISALGKQFLDAQAKPAALQLWQTVPEMAGITAMQLVDLAIAAVNNDMVELAVASASRAPTITTVDSAEAPSQSAGSLGQLLATPSAPSRTVSVSPFDDPTDQPDSKLAQQLLKLDTLWKEKNLDAQQGLNWQVAWIAPAGKLPNPFAISPDRHNRENINVESLFDRFARRAAEAKQTEAMVARLKPKADGDKTPAPSELCRLLCAHLWLRDKQIDKAVDEFKAIDRAAINGFPSAQNIQTLTAALEEDGTRPVAAELLLHWIGENKPTEQYQEIEPFMSLSMKVAQMAIEKDMSPEVRDAAINAFMECTVHNNKRYGGSYGVRNLIEQNEQIARPFLMRGQVAEALKYLAQREPAFNMGLDYQNDWVGSWALESLQGSQDHAQAYRTLVEWTFNGDGAVHSLTALSRRAPLPAWIPANVGGKYPTFGPTVDPLLPLASNFYSLAKLAEETNNTADLLQRFEAAHKQGRAGADSGWAIALVALKQPLPDELLTPITARIEKLKPADPQAETQTVMPLADLQLALLLVGDSKHAAWSQQVIESIGKNSRNYLLPWLARYRHVRGWSETAKLSPANQLPHWLSSTSDTAHGYYEGDAPSLWVTDGQSRVENICGHGQSDLWLRYPLEGDFQFEFETDKEPGTHARLAVAGFSFQVNSYNRDNVYVDANSEAYRDSFRTSLKDVKADSALRCSVVAEAGNLKLKINDQEFYSQPQPAEPIWISIRAGGAGNVAKNIKLTGQPKIPNRVNLIGKDDLRAWTGLYYSQALPSIHMVEPKKKDDDQLHYFYEGVAADKLKELSWSVKDGELISGQSTSAGPGNQSVIQLARPLGEGEKLEYEFYYEPGKIEVHPTFGRTALVLRAEGIHQHWMTENNTSWSTPHDYEAKLDGTQPLPLKANQWNKMLVERSGDHLKLTLNNQTILDQAWDFTTPGSTFGLFHYRDKTQVRVRQANLSGPWPEKLPEQLLTTQQISSSNP